MPNDGKYDGHNGAVRDPWLEPHFCPLKCVMKLKWYPAMQKHFQSHIDKGQVTNELAKEKLDELFPHKYPNEAGAAAAATNSDDAGEAVADDDLWPIFATQALDE